jgi:8-oxo-dGTP pyrophosphatase MutT (NUDIX family)
MDHSSLNDKLLKGDKDKFFVTVVPVNAFNEVLLGKRTEDGIWTTPGGGSEPGETPMEAARRELFEEAGLVALPVDMQLVAVNSTPRGFQIFLYVWRVPGSPIPTSKLDPDHEVKTWKFYPVSEFPSGLHSEANKTRFDTIRQALMKYHGITKSEDLDTILLVDKLTKGGPGSGVKGHMTHRADNGQITLKNPKNVDDASSLLTEAGKHLEDAQAHHKKHNTHDSGMRMDHAVRQHSRAIGMASKFKDGQRTEPQKMKDARHGIKREEDTRTEAQRMADTRRGGPEFKRDWGKSEVETLIDKLNKGGPGSGQVGHVTAKQPSALHPHLNADLAKPTNKLQGHLQALEHGGVMPGLMTQSDKPVVNSMEAARAHGYDVQDHVDAMNAHYELAQKTQAILEKLKTAGHKIPAEGAKIVHFHEKKMKEHMKARQYLESRQKVTDVKMKEKKAAAVASVKKAVTGMGTSVGDRDLDTGSFAQTNAQADADWMERLYTGMADFNYADEPRDFGTPKGTMTLCKVDDGLYSGVFTKIEGGLEDHAKTRIERMTIPELVQLMLAKEWISNHMLDQPEEAPAQHEQIEALNTALQAPVSTIMVPQQTFDATEQRIRVLELLAKLVG